MQAEPAVKAVTQPGAAAHYGRQVGRFALSSMEMCAAMCVGDVVLGLVFFQGAALIGYPNFFEQNFLLSVLVLGIIWALAMGIYMAVRGHPLGHNLEMSGTAVVAALILVAAYSWLGLVHTATIPGWFGQFTFQCGPTCALMGVDMLARYRHYTAGADQHAHEVA